MSEKKFLALFEKRRRQAIAFQPGLLVSGEIGDPARFPALRDYAYSAWDGRRAQITFAPKVVDAPEAQQDALIRHELAHALLQTSNIKHSERECDATAETIFGGAIYYDQNDIQTLDNTVPGAQRPRPAHLPN